MSVWQPHAELVRFATMDALIVGMNHYLGSVVKNEVRPAQRLDDKLRKQLSDHCAALLHFERTYVDVRALPVVVHADY